MSLLNGKVEAPKSRKFRTYEEASKFAGEIMRKYGYNAFEGFQVRADGYTVNYCDHSGGRTFQQFNDEIHEQTNEYCNSCGACVEIHV